MPVQYCVIVLFVCVCFFCFFLHEYGMDDYVPFTGSANKHFARIRGI